MIPVAPAAKPKDFDAKVREPGLRAIAEMVGKRPQYPRNAGRRFGKVADSEDEIPADAFPPYWTECLNDLMAAYDETCAYSCFRIHPVTGSRSVDHFVAKSRNWRRVYEWSNYRLCATPLNARKGDFRGVLDPFKVQHGWFHIELLGFQVIPNPKLSSALRAKVQKTIDLLGLNQFARSRAVDAERYWDGAVRLRDLKRESPFVAYELNRQGRLNPGDAW